MKTAYCGSTAHSQNDRVYALVGTKKRLIEPCSRLRSHSLQRSASRLFIVSVAV